MTTATIGGTRVLLRLGERYRARAHISKPTFLVADADIRAILEDEGFADVSVWRTVESLPKDWPSDQRAVVQGIADFTAFVEATWNQEDETRLKPVGIVAIWVHPPVSSGTVTLPEVTIYGEESRGGGGGTGKVTLPEVTFTGDTAPAAPGVGLAVAIGGAVGIAYGYHRAAWPGAFLGGALGVGAVLIAADLARKHGTTTGGA